MFAIQGCVASEDRDKSYKYNIYTHTHTQSYIEEHTHECTN